MHHGKEHGWDYRRSDERKGLNMEKIISPCTCEVYRGNARAFAKITYEDGKLSISGVIGPTGNGNCKGSCGQCVDEIRSGEPVAGWNREMIDKLCKIWDEWHLNDMHPYCEHQKQLGWDKIAMKTVTLYNYCLKREVRDIQRSTEKEALASLKEGKTFRPTDEQVMYANLPYSMTLHEGLSENEAKYYEPEKQLYPGGKGPTERKTLGWLSEKEHPDGILSKACPVCGYKYGNGWMREEVPQDVITWLFSLPDTEVTPAWV